MKKLISVKGMHCISCELILEKGLKKIDGVSLVMVNHKKGLLEVEYKDELLYDKVVDLIEESGFRVKGDGEKLNSNNFLGNIVAILAVVIMLIVSSLFDFSGILPDSSGMGIWGAFLIGIIASISTCLAITGGIIIGFSRYMVSTHSTLGHVKVQLGFQLGRILGFFILGGILGMIGEIFVVNLSITGIVTFLVGFLLVYMGLNILHIAPSVSKFGIYMPKGFVSKIESLGKPKYAPIVGALTFFIPCGFTQTVQLLAVSSGSFWSGALVMSVFALGTAPVLFSVGLGSSYFRGKKFFTLNKVIGAIVIFFGIFTLNNSFNLLSFSSPVKQENNSINESVLPSEFEVVKIGHDGWQTNPLIVNLKAGGNYKIVVTPDSNGKGCMSTQVIPSLSKKVSYVMAGIPITYKMIDAKAGTYNIVCASMGMKQGQIIVK